MMRRLLWWWRDAVSRVRGRRTVGEIDEELSLHVELQTERHLSEGVPAAEARRRALVEFGGVERYRERTSDVRWGAYLEEFVRDSVHGMRAFVRSPLYAVSAVVLLGVGMGAGTAMFAISHGVLERDLPYGEPASLYRLLEANSAGGIRTPSYPSFEDWTKQLSAFASVAWIRGDEFRLRTEEGTHRLLAGYITDDFFRMAGTPAQLGRVLDASDESAVVIADHVWRRRFGGDPDVLGRTLTTADGSYNVVGVMPRGFRLPAWADVWLSVRALPAADRYALTQRDLHVDAEAWGRVRDGVAAEQAQQDLARVVSVLAETYPSEGEWTGARLIDIRTHVVGDAGDRLRILMGAVGLVLLLTCMNVAGLQLARGSARTAEMALRAALGAPRGRLVRQMVAESAVLSIAGGVLGCVLAWVALSALTRQLPDVLPRLDTVTLDAPALAFALALVVITALFTGIMPALGTLGRRLQGTLRSGATAAGVSGRVARLRGLLVSAQIALALVLVVGSTLLLRSLAALQTQQLGFEPADVVVLRVFPPQRYDNAISLGALYEQLRSSVESVPGIRTVGLANHVPFGGGWMVTRFDTGLPVLEGNENVLVRTVSPEYFDVLGTRLMSGRLLRSEDAAIGTGIVINSVVANRFFGDEDAVGRTVTLFHSAQGREEFGQPVGATIVGVVEAERFFGLEQEPPPAVFVPWNWMVWGNITLVARTTGGAAPLDALRAAVHRVDADIPVAGPGRQAEWRPLADHVGLSLTERRLTAGLFTAFGAVALLLALTGIFATTAYLVARRQRELAIRSALGASRFAILRMVLASALRLAAAGAVVGVPAAIAAGVLLRSELFGIGASDPRTLVAVTVTFLGAAAAAAALPAVRAASIPPATTLKAE